MKDTFKSAIASGHGKETSFYNGYIYLIVSPSFKYYVGQTNNIKKRHNGYNCLEKTKNSTKVGKSVKKYGFKNHSFDVLLQCDEKQLDLWEKFYIKLFDSFNTNHGLNLTDGGGRNYNVVFKPKSEEWKIKASESKTGKKRQPFSNEWKRKLSEASRRRVIDENYRNSMKVSAKKRKERHQNWFEEETKKKISSTLKEYFKSEEGINKRIAISERCRNTFKKKVIQYSKQGEFIREYDCMNDASKDLKICRGDISRCCNGIIKSAGGFIWKKA